MPAGQCLASPDSDEENIQQNEDPGIDRRKLGGQRSLQSYQKVETEVDHEMEQNGGEDAPPGQASSRPSLVSKWG